MEIFELMIEITRKKKISTLEEGQSPFGQTEYRKRKIVNGQLESRKEHTYEVLQKT